MTASAAGSDRRERLKAKREAALHRPVLARHLSDGFNGRWTRRQWVQASLFATLGMLVAAIVPGFGPPAQHPQPLHAPRHSMALALPPLPLSRLKGTQGDSWQVVHVRRGQTLGGVFEELGIPAATLHRLLEHPGVKQSLTRLKPGTELAFDLPADGQLRTFRYDRDESHRVELGLAGDKIVEKVIERPIETRTVVISGKVGRSLFHSARKLGLSPSNINTLTDEIFKYDIDFNEDVAASDRFSVVVEQAWREGELIRTGPVLAATFTTGGKLHTGFRFERNGKAEYFSGDGRPLKKSFIRMPIPYARLTSKFGSRRHPVLGNVRMHKGVDYAAATGTPIMAAGDARVEFVGWKGGYGRTVILDHGRGYTTLYGHMSNFGKIRRGQRIGQGTVIGYVGSSGLATGPHLHYEFRINGVHRNPLQVTMPPPEPLRGAALAQFRAQTAVALARIQEVEKIIFADAGQPADPGKAKPVRPKA
ncbi:M23 family metallopeptidase [Vulcaniibacterium tengchongense]|uniref:Murein DD-endopeptidase MepM/ murein hydrolase activator NlpD n=1 Tax=Vulcaniibacterium tengchongense TaxID=1273429 RepID=A0A3N4V0P4_9GAMM|nr:murein DD-endopeptidase MepM/ murein hydrolase activator NlpD [Vulcaniibacterium tengchongense]